jgi:hypothetical protein
MVAIMGDTPPKRIYLDSNILWNWPNCSNQIWNLFEFARWLKTEVYFPEIVEKELERQFLNSVDEITDRIDADLKNFRKQCRYIIEIDTPGQAPTYQQLQEAFRERSNALKAHYGIQTIPLTTMTLDVFIDMAINREPPFEELSSKSKTGVVGLQDAAILFSIIQHIKKTPDPGRCIFLSNDGIFYRNEIRDFLTGCEITLERIKSAELLWSELFHHVWPEVQKPWQAEMAQIETDLNAEKERFAGEIEQTIDIPNIPYGLWARAQVKKAFRVREFDLVTIEPAEIQHRPPRAEYHRPEGSEVTISARATADLDALVGPSFWDLVGRNIYNPDQVDSPTPDLEDATLTEYLNLSLVGIVHGGKISAFKITAVEPYKS